MSEDGSVKLQPPLRTNIEDSGAHELDSSDSDDHFSDALSGLNSPVPITRVEKVDDDPSYGEVPGTDAYNIRTQDAEPDEIAIIPDGSEHVALSSRSTTPGGFPVPTTVVEKVDQEDSPSLGEVPGTQAHKLRNADAVPDLVLRPLSPKSPARSRAGSTPGDRPIPTTRVEKVDSKPSHGEVPGTDAYEIRKGDAEPDVEEVVGDFPGSPTSLRSPTIRHTRRKSSNAGRASIPVASTAATYDEEEDGDDGDFGDDFDDFEEGDEDTGFDDFDDGFQDAAVTTAPPVQSLPQIAPSFPVLDFEDLDTPEEIYAATEPYMNALYPPDTISSSTVPTATHDNPVFLTQRSASLWSQLVAPPPLQPPDWIRSRIRRLFLVSLGVPVDLDEILPASKQKKLILPSTSLHPNHSSPRNSTDTRPGDSISRLKQENTSNTSLDSQGKPSRSSSRRRKGPPPAPELDLVSARQLCSITDEALNGLTPRELKDHVAKLENMRGVADEVLDYWTKRTDEKIGDREAFEGVIENLVKHARKVRK